MKTRLRARIDDVNEQHVTLTFFECEDGHNWANNGRLVFGRQWLDEGPLAGAPVGSKVEVVLGIATGLAEGGSIDERLDLLKQLRDRGHEPTDVKLSKSGHDFIVSLDLMGRIIHADDKLLDAINAVHMAVHRGASDKQLNDEIVRIAREADHWPLDPPGSEAI